MSAFRVSWVRSITGNFSWMDLYGLDEAEQGAQPGVNAHRCPPTQTQEGSGPAPVPELSELFWVRLQNKDGEDLLWMSLTC